MAFALKLKTKDHFLVKSVKLRDRLRSENATIYGNEMKRRVTVI